MYLIIDFIRHAQSESNMYKLEYNYIKKTMIVNPKVTPVGYKQINNVRNIKSSKGKFIKRYETYEKNIKPVTDFYKKSNLLKVVNGEAAITEISNEISGLIEGIKG